MIHLVIKTLNLTGVPTIESEDTTIVTDGLDIPFEHESTETYFCQGHSFLITFDLRTVSSVPSFFSCPSCTAVASNFPEGLGVPDDVSGLLQWREEECPSQAVQLEAVLSLLMVS